MLSVARLTVSLSTFVYVDVDEWQTDSNYDTTAETAATAIIHAYTAREIQYDVADDVVDLIISAAQRRL